MSSESETDIDDDIFELACNYKLTGKYPKDCPQNKKRTIRRQAKSIILQNGEVWIFEWVQYSPHEAKSDTHQEECIYITNVHNHFEPVKKMM